MTHNLKIKNIYSKIPADFPEELFEEILNTNNFKLERIVSKAHSTPEGQWLFQEKEEWVLLLKGSAGILIKDEDKEITLEPGNYIHIPAHCNHRVQWTDKENETIWLTLHF